jgi:hypothetical protein
MFHLYGSPRVPIKKSLNQWLLVSFFASQVSQKLGGEL